VGNTLTHRISPVLVLPYVLVVVSLLLSACALVPQAQPRPTVTLRVVAIPQLSSAPFYIGIEEGHFTEQGIQVEIVRLAQSRQGIPSLAQGDVDVLGGGVTVGLLNAMQREGKISIVADKGYHDPQSCPNGGLVAKRSLVEAGGLRSPADLKGRKIALDLATAGEFHTEKVLATAGLSIEDVSVVELPDTALQVGLEQGAIDLAFVGEPTMSRIVRSGHGVLWKATREVSPNYPGGVLAYGPSLLEKNTDAGNRFMVGYLKAVRQYNQGPTERNLEILTKAMQIDRSELEQTCWPAFRADGAINVQSVGEFQSWAIQKGLLDAALTEDKFWDPRFVNHANKTLGAAG
jgi:NitT/TauT family transport system substrate-binding protein